MSRLPAHVADRSPAVVVDGTVVQPAPGYRPAVRGGPSLAFVLVLILVLFGSAFAVGLGLSLL